MQPVECDAGFVNVTAENIFSFFCQYVYVDILNFVYYLHLLDIADILTERRSQDNFIVWFLIIYLILYLSTICNIILLFVYL